MCKWLSKYFGRIFDLVKCFKYSLPFTGMCLKETTGSGDENTYSSLNRPFPSSPGPLYQNEVKCSAFDMEIIFHSHANKIHFHKKGCALGLILNMRVFGTWKWPINLPTLQLLTSYTSCLLRNQYALGTNRHLFLLPTE